jgi:hypothetical protein
MKGNSDHQDRFTWPPPGTTEFTPTTAPSLFGSLHEYMPNCILPRAVLQIKRTKPGMIQQSQQAAVGVTRMCPIWYMSKSCNTGVCGAAAHKHHLRLLAQTYNVNLLVHGCKHKAPEPRQCPSKLGGASQDTVACLTCICMLLRMRVSAQHSMAWHEQCTHKGETCRPCQHHSVHCSRRTHGLHSTGNSTAMQHANVHLSTDSMTWDPLANTGTLHTFQTHHNRPNLSSCTHGIHTRLKRSKDGCIDHKTAGHGCP